MSRIKSLARRLWGNLMVRRATHTFYQAFLSTLMLGVPAIITTFKLHGVSGAEAAGVALLVAAGAAGLAALRTGIANVIAARQIDANTAQQV